jgi:SNF2 family DNA or RNA helicase
MGGAMLVIPDKRKIIINSSNNAAIAECIPHAKTFDHNGDKLLAMPYGVDESLVLRNFGLSVPPPITQYYRWPGRFAPMAHQKETAAFLTTHKRALCLNAPGTGKSISALWAADFLLEEKIARKVLIIAPLSTLQVVWGREIMHHLSHRNFVVCTGTKEKRQRLLQQTGVQYVIINHDGFTNMQSELTGFDVVIYDEATALKSPSSQRYKIFAKWVQKNQPWLWMLTGTPISQAPADAWTLARLVDSPSVPKSYTTFKDLVMKKVSTFRWVPREDALETCKKVLQPSIRFSLDECKDLPDTNYVSRKTTLTKQQEKAFKEMQDKAVTVFAAGEVAAPNAAVMLSKLLQISCGVVYGDTGAIAIDASERYNTLTELLTEIGDKTIIFVPLKGVQLWLRDKLIADGHDVAMVNGDTTKAQRNQIFNDFQHTDTPKILLAHPKVAAHGLTLTRAKDIIWFAPIYSLEQYEQANARIRRITTTGKTTVWHIYATSFEGELYRRLRAKQNTLAEFLTLVQGVNSDD